MQKNPSMFASFNISIYHLCGCVNLLTSSFGSLALALIALITIIGGARLALPHLIFIGLGLIASISLYFLYVTSFWVSVSS